jgi:hypothetical protein
MDLRDHQALEDCVTVLERGLDFPIPDFQILRQTTYRQDAVMRDVLIHAYDQIDLEEVWVAYQHFSEIRSLVADILAQDLLATKICHRSRVLVPSTCVIDGWRQETPSPFRKTRMRLLAGIAPSATASSP